MARAPHEEGEEITAVEDDGTADEGAADITEIDDEVETEDVTEE